MLTRAGLATLERSLRGQAVLSVYVNGEGADSISRNRYRTDLRHSLDDVEKWLRGSSHAEREAFATCRNLVLAELDSLPGLGAPGWAGFFTSGGAHGVGTVAVPVPTMAIWSTGPGVAPYIRALKEANPVILAIVDSRQVRLYRYLNRDVELLETLRPTIVLEPPSHLGRPARVGYHTGTRGRTGADAAQRELQRATDQMLSEAADRIAAFAVAPAWIVIGGIPSVASAALARLSPEPAGRAIQAAHLDVHATDSLVAECARESASRLRDAHDLLCVERVLGAAQAGGTGVAGSLDVQRALEAGQVRELYFTLRFLEAHAAAVEAAVRAAFDTGATIEHVSGEAAVRLDAMGGIAAQLRFALAREVAQSAVGASGSHR